MHVSFATETSVADGRTRDLRRQWMAGRPGIQLSKLTQDGNVNLLAVSIVRGRISIYPAPLSNLAVDSNDRVLNAGVLLC